MWFGVIIFILISAYLISTGINGIRNRYIYLNSRYAGGQAVNGQRAVAWGWVFVIVGILIILGMSLFALSKLSNP